LAVDRRDWAGNRRDEAGIRRDYAGDLRDHAADQRDQAADERDQAADQRDQAAERSESSITPTGKTGPRNESALARRQAAADRRRASQDRGAGASERTEAELDRDTALADRGASAREREHASHDDLTGAYLRGAGFVELERDIGRARRDRQPLVLVFADVDGLKVINDVHGHAAGDRTLLAVASALRAKLRPHDLIIRYGGDEFVCAISGAKTADARERLALVNAALADGPEHGSISVGLAELLPFDSAGDLVARADAALYRQRRRTRSTRPAMAGVPS
jgi:diguanylate cyclase (GGDEF)-like protein